MNWAGARGPDGSLKYDYDIKNPWRPGEPVRQGEVADQRGKSSPVGNERHAPEAAACVVPPKSESLGFPAANADYSARAFFPRCTLP
jgi:hypothetical protein